MNSQDNEQTELLREILKWTKFESMQKVKGLLDATLDTDVKRIVYESSNGLSSPEIAQIAGVDPTTVRDYWKAWAILGIVEIHPDFRKRYRRMFSLKDVGIEVPNPRSSSESKPKDAKVDGTGEFDERDQTE